MRKIYPLVLFLVLASVFYTYSQTSNGYAIKGKVMDIDGNPLTGASVTIAGTYTGTQTSVDGIYLLTGLKGGVYLISFSFIGYETLIRRIVLNGDSTINTELKTVSVITDDVIISATRAGKQTPLSYSNISGELLEKRNSGQDMPYLLSLTPSFVETSEAGNGVGYTNMRIRGTEASRINVTIDGIPLNDPESQQVFWVDLPDLASSVDNIQIQRGVGTSSNGAGAFGASVNIQTRGIENEPFAEINSLAGSFGTYKNSITAGTGLMKEKFAFQMRLSDVRSMGYIERTGSDHNSAFLSALWRTGKSLLKANLILGKEHTGIGWWGVPEEMLTVNRRYNPAGSYTDDNGVIKYYDNESDNYYQNHFQLIYSRKINENYSFHSALHYTKGKGYYEEFREDDLFSDYGLPPVNIGDTTLFYTDLIRRKWMSNDFYGLIYSLNYRKNKTEASIGGGMNFYSGDHYGNIIWMEYPGASEKDYQWYFNTGEKSEASIYGKISGAITQKITIFGDVQYRFIKYNLTGIEDDLRNIGQVHRFGFFNPKAGLFCSISSNQDAFISLSVANREPTRTDFTEASGDNSAEPKPERLYDTEAGYKLRFPKSSASVNLFWMIYKDQLVPTGELSNVGYSIMTNVGRSYRMGAEITAGFKPADFLNWDLSFTLSRNKIPEFYEHYTDYNTSDGSSEYKSRYLGNVDIAYSPSVTAVSDISARLIPVIKIHLISKFVGKQFFDNTMNNSRMLDPYLVNNILIDFEPKTKHLRGADLQLLLNNIFDAEYENNAYGGTWSEDGIEKSWAYYFPQAGINFMFKLGLKF